MTLKWEAPQHETFPSRTNQDKNKSCHLLLYSCQTPSGDASAVEGPPDKALSLPRAWPNGPILLPFSGGTISMTPNHAWRRVKHNTAQNVIENVLIDIGERRVDSGKVTNNICTKSDIIRKTNALSGRALRVVWQIDQGL